MEGDRATTILNCDIRLQKSHREFAHKETTEDSGKTEGNKHGSVAQTRLDIKRVLEEEWKQVEISLDKVIQNSNLFKPCDRWYNSEESSKGTITIDDSHPDYGDWQEEQSASLAKIFRNRIMRSSSGQTWKVGDLIDMFLDGLDPDMPDFSKGPSESRQCHFKKVHSQSRE